MYQLPGTPPPPRPRTLFQSYPVIQFIFYFASLLSAEVAGGGAPRRGALPAEAPARRSVVVDAKDGEHERTGTAADELQKEVLKVAGE